MSCVGNTSIQVASSSFWLLTENVVRSGSTTAPITFDGTSSLIVGNGSNAAASEAMSWVLWASNNMSSAGSDTCVQIQGSLAINSDGYMSVIENRCTSSRWMWRNGTGQGTVASGSGVLLVRCNVLNGTVSSGSGMPPSAMSAGVCGACNSTAECYAPLTAVNSNCGPKPGRSLEKVVCTCSPGGGGARCTPETPRASLTLSASTSLSLSFDRHSPSGTSSSTPSASGPGGSRTTTNSLAATVSKILLSSSTSVTASRTPSSSGTATLSNVNSSRSDSASATATERLTRGTVEKDVTASSVTMSRTGSVDPCGNLSYAKTTGDMVGFVTGSAFLVILTPLVAAPSATTTTTESLAVLVLGCAYSDLAASPATINVTLAANRLLKYGGLMAPLPLPRVIVDSPSPVEASVVNGSSFSLTVAPVDYNKFTTVSIFVTLPVTAFYCEGKSAGITIELLVSGSPLAVAMSTAMAVARSASATCIVSGTPAAAVASARVSMLQYLLSCQFNPKDVAYGNSLTGYLFGPKRGAPVRGAILGNLLVFVLAVIFVVLICLVFAVGGAIWFGSGVMAGLRSMLNLFHFPSAVMMPAAAVMQPTVAAACTLLVYSPPMAPYDPQFAAWVLVFVASYCCWVTYVLLFAFGCELAELPPKAATDLTAESKQSKWTVLRGRIGRILEPGLHWEVREGCDAAWKQKMLILFADFKYPQYAVLELWMSVVLGVTTGLVLPHEWVCTAQIAICIAGYGVLLLVDLVLRPGLSMYTQSFLVLSNGLGLVSSAANMWASSSDESSAQSLSILSSLTISVLSTAKSLLDILMLALAVPSLVRMSRDSLAELAGESRRPTDGAGCVSDTRQPAHARELEREQHAALDVVDRRGGIETLCVVDADDVDMPFMIPMMQDEDKDGLIDALLVGDLPAPQAPSSLLLGVVGEGQAAISRESGSGDAAKEKRQAAVDAALRLLYSPAAGAPSSSPSMQQQQARSQHPYQRDADDIDMLLADLGAGGPTISISSSRSIGNDDRALHAGNVVSDGTSSGVASAAPGLPSARRDEGLDLFLGLSSLGARGGEASSDSLIMLAKPLPAGAHHRAGGISEDDLLPSLLLRQGKGDRELRQV